MLTEKKKKHNLKVESYVLFGGQTEDLSLEDSISDSSEEVKGGARIYRRFLQRPGSRNIKR